MVWADVARSLNALACGIALGVLFAVIRTYWSEWSLKALSTRDESVLSSNHIRRDRKHG